MDNVAPPRTDGALLRARRGTRYPAWRAHAVLLALVGGYIGLSAIQSTTDANIGLGLGLLALGAMGAPWSVPLFLSERMTVDSGLFVAVDRGGSPVQPPGSCDGLGAEERQDSASSRVVGDS